MHEVLRRFLHVYDRAPIDRLIRIGVGGCQLIRKKWGLRDEKSLVDAERYVASDEDDVAVDEPELLVALGGTLR